MKSIQYKTTILATAVALMLSPVNSGAKPNKVKHFGKNAPFLIDDLPTGKMKSKLRALRRDKQRRAMNWLHSFDFTRHDLKHLEIDDKGDVLYGDSFDMTELAETANEPTEQPQPVSAADIFNLHSNPGAANVIYIDFNGHTISGTAWNSSSSSIQARPFDTDGNTASFSDAEIAQIAEIWHRVAEDFAPFNTDVTTEEPANFGSNTGRILITHNKDVSGNNMPYSTAGGVAYINVWGRSNYASYYSPALVYYNNLASFAPYISEAAAHEMGHNLGLSHDGTSTQSYYAGHGSGFVSWAPIMGVGYYNNITQWSKGEYTDASISQDDISIISSHLNFRNDDHGSDIYTPTPLLVDAQGNITVTSPETDPHNLSPENKGIIETRNDVDFFAFDAGAGALDISVTPAWDAFYRSSRRGANLDVQASLYNWDGQLIASSDPLNETDAQITTTVAAGQYLLAVSGVGNNVTPYSDYGSLGQYFISGNVEPFTSVTDSTPPSPNPMGWSVAPYSQSRNSISMQASTATDDSGTVQYNFICLSGAGCSDSGWQTSNQYTATGLLAGSSYSFQVMARDAYNNETNPSSTASATTAANNAPQTVNSSTNVQEDNSVSIDLASQSSDADADPLTFVVQQPSNGSVINHNNGTVSYTPASNFNGTDNFSYTVSDGFGGSANGSVSITVTAVNDAPVASASAPSNNSTLTVSFSSAGSFDPDSTDTLTYNWNFGDGSSSNAANPSHSYSSEGSYTTTLTVMDNHGLSDNTSISTTVSDPTHVIPEAPSNLTYTILDKTVTGRGRRKVVTGSLKLNWSPSNSATKYDIWRCEEITTGRRRNRITTCTYALYASTDDTFLIDSLSSNPVRYKMTAENNNGTSAFSTEIRVKH